MNRLKYFSTPFCLLLIAVSFLSVLIGESYTHWDTFDVITTNFIYLSDSLRNGFLSFWNPFVLSGSPILASSFFTNSLYSPIDLGFLLLSLIFSPIYLTELNIILGAYLFFYGSKFLFQRINFSKSISNYIAVMSTLIMIPPIVGQISFVYSLATLVWLTFFNLDDRKKTFFKVLLQSFIIASLAVKGYFYYITIFFLFNVSITIYKTRKENLSVSFLLRQKLPLFVIPTIFFLILNLEGALDFINQYRELGGDLIIKEPRLRQISGNMTHGLSLSKIFKSLISFRESSWVALNFSYYSLIILPLSLISLKNFKKQKKILLLSILLVVIFSSNERIILSLTSNIPIISSFRWIFYNLHIAIFLIIILSAYGLREMISLIPRKIANLLSLIILLIVFSISFKLGIQKESPGGRRDMSLFPKKLKDKRKSIPISNKNFRSLNNKKEFEYNDYSWLSKKIPISHGYNNTISEYYWRMKDMQFNKEIVNFSCNTKLIRKAQRKGLNSDNEYIDAIISQIAPTGSSYLINKKKLANKCSKSQYKISNLSLSPNSLSFNIKTTTKGMIIISQHNKPGWSASIDHVKTNIYNTNYLFQGLHIKSGGKYIVKLTYFPRTAVVLIMFYLLTSSLLYFSYINLNKS